MRPREVVRTSNRPSAATGAQRLFVLFALLIPASGQSAGASEMIGGRVTTMDRRPLAGAIVSIVAVRPVRGASLANAWCYPDCGKHAVTDAQGSFAIRGLDPQWFFAVYVEAKGYIPQTALAYPRSTQPLLEISLTSQDAPPGDAQRRVVGRVLEPDGQPAADAVVTSFGHKPGGPWRTARVDYFAITNQSGDFHFESDLPLSYLNVNVSARGATRERLFRLKPGPEGNTLQLLAGATVTGRVLAGAKPVAAVAVGMTCLATKDESVATSYESVTDSSGRFTFDHVAANKDCRLFTPMASLGEKNLAAIVQEIHTPADGHTMEVGELNLHPAHRVRGRLATSNGSRVPAQTVAILERVRTADWLEVEVDEAGSFSFSGVPSEPVVLFFHTAGFLNVPGYRISPHNRSLDARGALRGFVDDDVTLDVQIDPGPSRHIYIPGELPPLPPNNRLPSRNLDREEQRRLEMKPLRGVAGE